jgi:seryl-tRNA synthetase
VEARVTSVPASDGLQILGRDELCLLRTFDAVILTWADEIGAMESRYPFLLEPAFLDGIDYYENFPHLGLAVSAAEPEKLIRALASAERPLTALPAEALQGARYALPSAACYSVYQSMYGRTVPAEGVRHTTVATCFRNEERYEAMRRLLGFSMREIVFVGPAEGAQEHLIAAKERVLALASKLGLAMKTEIASDPFFDKNGTRARMQLRFPVKEEFVVGGLAVGSVNYHRNFFGERCEIRLPGGEPVNTSCVAFGLERWVHALTAEFGDATAAVAALRDVG